MKTTIKSLLVITGLLVVSATAWGQRRPPQQPPHQGDGYCSTHSRGLRFEAEGRDAARHVVDQCIRNRNTMVNECERNLQCYQRPVPPPSQTRLDSVYRYCQSNTLCTYDITWRTNTKRNILVTVQKIGEDLQEKVFACFNRDGSQTADWIQRDKRYVFKAYEVRDCHSSFRNSRAVHAIDLVHRGGRR